MLNFDDRRILLAYGTNNSKYSYHYFPKILFKKFSIQYYVLRLTRTSQRLTTPGLIGEKKS